MRKLKKTARALTARLRDVNELMQVWMLQPLYAQNSSQKRIGDSPSKAKCRNSKGEGTIQETITR